MTSNKPSVYISYQWQGANRSPLSQQVAQLLHETLNQRGIDAFWDHDLPAGTNFRVEQERQLSGRDILIVVLSPTTYLSVSGVIPEIRRALELKKRIIPIKVDGFHFSDPQMGEPFGEVRNFISIQFEAENAEAFVEKLVKDIMASPVSSVPPSITVAAGGGNGTPPIVPNGDHRRGIDLRDPIWQFIFGAGGILLALITLIVTVALSRQPSPATAELTGTYVAQYNASIVGGASTTTQDMLDLAATMTDLARISATPRPTLNIIPVATIAAPTLTSLPTLTPTIADTPVPPTLTNTPIPPSATSAPVLATTIPTDPPNASTNTNAPTITLFHDADSLALYIPTHVSLMGLVFQANNYAYTLNDYASFAGLPWESISVPACFVLRLANSNTPLVGDCQQVPSNHLFIQQVSPADVFWHNSTTGIDPVITVMQNGATLAICPGSNAACDISTAGGS